MNAPLTAEAEIVSVMRGARELIVISGRRNAAELATMAEELAARRRAEGKVVMLTSTPGIGTRDTVGADVLISVREYGAAWAGEGRHGR
jgi:hypothetical protein